MDVIHCEQKDFITKDGKQLSVKQIKVLLMNNILNVNDLTYQECSKKIGDFLKDYSNKKMQNTPVADRGFDDCFGWEDCFMYSESEMC